MSGTNIDQMKKTIGVRVASATERPLFTKSLFYFKPETTLGCMISTLRRQYPNQKLKPEEALFFLLQTKAKGTITVPNSSELGQLKFQYAPAEGQLLNFVVSRESVFGFC